MLELSRDGQQVDRAVTARLYFNLRYHHRGVIQFRRRCRPDQLVAAGHLCCDVVFYRITINSGNRRPIDRAPDMLQRRLAILRPAPFCAKGERPISVVRYPRG